MVYKLCLSKDVINKYQKRVFKDVDKMRSFRCYG